MIRALGTLALILIVMGIVGYYRGWFVADTHDSSGERTLSIKVDKAKIDQDKAEAKRKVDSVLHAN